MISWVRGKTGEWVTEVSGLSHVEMVGTNRFKGISPTEDVGPLGLR